MISTIKDLVLFIVGVAGIIYEALGEDNDRPYLLLLFASLVGVPFLAKGVVPGKKKSSEDSGKCGE